MTPHDAEAYDEEPTDVVETHQLRAAIDAARTPTPAALADRAPPPLYGTLAPAPAREEPVQEPAVPWLAPVVVTAGLLLVVLAVLAFAFVWMLLQVT